MGPAGPSPAQPERRSATGEWDQVGEISPPPAAPPSVAPTGPSEPYAGDNSTLRRLRAELGNDAAADHFVTDFLDLLDDRLSSLRSLIRRRRVEDSVTALLTIETSSLMIGADGLASVATRLRRAVSDQRTEALDPLLDELAGAAEQTKRELAPPAV